MVAFPLTGIVLDDSYRSIDFCNCTFKAGFQEFALAKINLKPPSVYLWPMGNRVKGGSSL